MSSDPADTSELSRPARRQAEIAAYVVEHGSVSANDLVEAFGVSVMTVHRDLDELERQGVVRKYRGGVDGAADQRVREQRRLPAEHRAEREGGAGPARPRDDRDRDVGDARRLDQRAGLVELFEDITPLTVATNFLPAISRLTELRGRSPCWRWAVSTRDPRLVRRDALRAGGRGAAHGSVVLQCLRGLGDARFHQEEEIVLVKQANAALRPDEGAARRPGKLQRTALHRLAPLTSFDVVVVDEKTPADQIAALRDNGATVEVAPL